MLITRLGVVSVPMYLISAHVFNFLNQEIFKLQFGLGS